MAEQLGLLVLQVVELVQHFLREGLLDLDNRVEVDTLGTESMVGSMVGMASVWDKG